MDLIPRRRGEPSGRAQRDLPAREAGGVLGTLAEHWREWGLLAFDQCDHDTRFHGAHQHPDAVGRVSGLCLALKVVPIFALPTGDYSVVRQQNAWIKVHLTCGVKTNIVTSVESRERAASNTKILPDLLQATTAHFDIRKVSADKGHSSVHNVNAMAGEG